MKNRKSLKKKDQGIEAEQEGIARVLKLHGECR
jgi:hypothetical protein